MFFATSHQQLEQIKFISLTPKEIHVEIGQFQMCTILIREVPSPLKHQEPTFIFSTTQQSSDQILLLSHSPTSLALIINFPQLPSLPLNLPSQ